MPFVYVTSPLYLELSSYVKYSYVLCFESIPSTSSPLPVIYPPYICSLNHCKRLLTGVPASKFFSFQSIDHTASSLLPKTFKVHWDLDSSLHFNCVAPCFPHPPLCSCLLLAGCIRWFHMSLYVLFSVECPSLAWS